MGSCVGYFIRLPIWDPVGVHCVGSSKCCEINQVDSFYDDVSFNDVVSFDDINSFNDVVSFNDAVSFDDIDSFYDVGSFNDFDSFNGVVSFDDIDSSSDKNYFVVNLFSWMKFYLKMIFTNVNQR